MPTVSITADNTDGFVYVYNSNWNTVHDSDGTANAYANNAVGSHPYYGASITYNGSGDFTISRCFFAFDTSAICATPVSAVFWFYPVTYDLGDIIAVRATKPDLTTGILEADFNNFSSTVYGPKLVAGTPNSSPGYEIVLNATARDHIALNDIFQICLRNYDHDYLDVAPTTNLGTTQYFGMAYSEYSTVARRPQLIYEPGDYEHDVGGIAAASICEVNGVNAGFIDEVTGV